MAGQKPFFGRKKKTTIRMSLKHSMCMATDVPGEQANMGSVGSLKSAKLFAPPSFFMLLLPLASVHLTNIYLFFPRFCLHTFTMKPFLYSSTPSTASPHLLILFCPFPNHEPVATSIWSFTALVSGGNFYLSSLT